MEFDKNTPASEEDRRLAEAKKLTLTPLHSDIAPEPEPDAEVVARHLNDGVLANAPNDTEQSSSTVQPSKGLLQPEQPIKKRSGQKPSFVILLIVVVGGGITLGITLMTLL
jgi:LPS O-antigen subunit length determinant protein (WzzB/FepE family)